MTACQRVSPFPVTGVSFGATWMIQAHESRTVASYRENSSTEPGPDFEAVHQRDRGAFAVRTRPRSEGNHHVYNQALILMRCVVAAEEYNMARHALPPIPASSQPARDFATPWAGARRSSSDSVRLEVPNREAQAPTTSRNRTPDGASSTALTAPS
jgi:hypothetical protein